MEIIELRGMIDMKKEVKTSYTLIIKEQYGLRTVINKKVMNSQYTLDDVLRVKKVYELLDEVTEVVVEETTVTTITEQKLYV